MEQFFTLPTKNKGTGAGGANTNKSGKSFEIKTELKKFWNNIENNIISFSQRDRTYLYSHQSHFRKWMSSKGYICDNPSFGNGCKNPDEVYIDEENKIVFWIEKKNQNVSGSVAEKLQTADFKRRNLMKNYPGWTIEYIFLLGGDHMKRENIKPELDYLDEIDVKYFFSDQLESLISYIESVSTAHELIELSRCI